MNAIKFIQDNGVDKAREVVEGAPVVIDGTDKPFTATHYNYHPRAPIEYINNDGTVIPLCIMEVNFPSYWIDLSDLKRLVESMDLVNCNGGWNGTKNTITLFQSSLDLGLHHGVGGVDAEVEIPRLKQAIADYDSIYGGEHV